MVETRSYLAILLVLASLTTCCFLGLHEIAASAQSKGGIVGNLIGQFKREDDEAEVREIRERAPQTREERQEAREQAEQQAAAYSVPASEPISKPPPAPAAAPRPPPMAAPAAAPMIVPSAALRTPLSVAACPGVLPPT